MKSSEGLEFNKNNAGVIVKIGTTINGIIVVRCKR